MDCVERFAALDALPAIRHLFIRRIPGIDVSADRETALLRLRDRHNELRLEAGLDFPLATAEQVHGVRVAVVEELATGCAEGADGLVTQAPGLCLGIYVADCCAIYLVDPRRHAIGLVHSGRKGTELGIVTNAIRLMTEQFGSDPADLIAQLSPCIRPPFFETDFAATIVAQCRAAGLVSVFDSGANTGADLERYYSYRVERGKTGRMLALLALLP
jgi:copper oxidase (laccase) domain-containing protein